MAPPPISGTISSVSSMVIVPPTLDFSFSAAAGTDAFKACVLGVVFLRLVLNLSISSLWGQSVDLCPGCLHSKQLKVDGTFGFSFFLRFSLGASGAFLDPEANPARLVSLLVSCDGLYHFFA